MSRAARPERAARPAAPATGASLPWLLLALGAIAGLTLAAYWAAPGHDFVALDDVMYVKENPAVLAKHYGDLLLSVVAGNFHPLTMLSMAWNVPAPLSATPFIVTNIVLHVLNTLLVFWLVWAISNRRLLVAAFVALLFGIHPMHVESVAWVSERKDVLYTFFFLSGLIAYWRYLLRREPALLALTFVLFVLSCLAKGMAVVFPVVMVLLDDWQRRPLFERRAVLEKLPFLAVSVLFGLVALDVQGGGTFHGLLRTIGDPADARTAPMVLEPMQRLMLPTHSYLAYLARVFVPLGLCAFDPYPSLAVMKQLPYVLAPLGFLATLALALWDRGRTRVLTFGIGWFLVTLALVLQWVPVGGAIVADRYAYLSYIGPFFILGMAIDGVFQRRRAPGIALWVAGGVFALLLFLQTIPQVATWRDPETLWARILDRHPDLAMIHAVRGMGRSQRGETLPALDDFRIAYDLGMQTPDVYMGLGAGYGQIGKLDSSLIMLNRGVAIAPGRGSLYFNRAATLQALGRQAEALGDLDRALKLLPPARAPQLHAARAAALMQLGRHAEAIADLDFAAAADSANSELLYNRGLCRLKTGDRAGAAADFRATLRLDPADARARNELRPLER